MAMLDDQLELLDQQLHQAHRNAIHAELSARGLGEVGHPMLMVILQSSGQAQRELAARLHISPAAVANSLKTLERDGYIRREPGAEDARRNQIILTDKGAAAVEGCCQTFEQVSRRMLAGFSEQERKQLLSFRRRMIQNLTGEVPAEPTAAKEES